MKPNADEPIDQLVRDALGKGADRPLPSFNPEQTWARLNLELQPQKRRWRPAVWWWAASLTGLLLLFGAAWYRQTANSELSDQVKGQNDERLSHQSEPEVRQPILPIKPESAQKKNPEKIVRHTPVTVERPVIILAEEPERVDSLIAQVPKPLEQRVSEPESPAAVASSPVKPRFQVMHINEYQAEEDAQPRLYRTQNLVRLGAAEPPSETAPAPPSMKIVLPQRHKSN